MADATAVHVRSRTSRIVVAAIAVLFVTSGLLGRRHEAQIAHVLDPSTGLVVHAQHLDGHHAPSKSSDIHGQADGGDHDACALSAAIHQFAVAVVAPAVAHATPAILALDTPCSRAAALADVYRFAPKTSPPITA
jgi:hypothetical protein